MVTTSSSRICSGGVDSNGDESNLVQVEEDEVASMVGVDAMTSSLLSVMMRPRRLMPLVWTILKRAEEEEAGEEAERRDDCLV